MTSRHNNRTKRSFPTYKKGMAALREELEGVRKRTSRTFWVGKQKYLVRKTSSEHLNLTVRFVRADNGV